MALLSQFIASFSNHGRYRLYKHLLHQVEHAGVQGLLIHLVKEEVDAALKSGVGETCVADLLVNSVLCTVGRKHVVHWRQIGCFS